MVDQGKLINTDRKLNYTGFTKTKNPIKEKYQAHTTVLSKILNKQYSTF